MDDQARLLRQLRAMLHERSNRRTLGAASANTLAPPAHDDGIADDCAEYAAQSAPGTAPPMQLNRVCDPGNPVDTSAVERSDAGVIPRNSPIPPRRTPGVVPVNRPRPLAICVLRICPLRL